MRMRSLRHRPIQRLLLRRAATRYARHGWDVIPGACLAGPRSARSGCFECEEPGCHAVACHPGVADWEAAAAHDVPAVRDWWRELPFSC